MFFIVSYPNCTSKGGETSRKGSSVILGKFGEGKKLKKGGPSGEILPSLKKTGRRNLSISSSRKRR